MTGEFCGVRLQQGAGEWITLAQDQCGQLKGRTLGTVTIAEGTSFYVEVQYDCTNWWSDCNVTFVFRYFDNFGNEYDKRSYTKTVPWAGAGIWVNPADGAILTPYREGSLRIEAWEGGQLQDWFVIGIRLAEPPEPEEGPPEPEYDPGKQPETPPPPPTEPEPTPEQPTEEQPVEEEPIPEEEEITIPGTVTVTVVMKMKPLFRSGIYVVFTDKEGNKIKDGMITETGKGVSVTVDPGKELKVYVYPKPGLVGKVVAGKATSGEETTVSGLTWNVVVKNFVVGGGEV